MEGESMSEWKEVRLGDYIEFNPYRKLRKGDKAKKITMDMLIPYSKQIYDYIVEPYNGGAKFQNGDTIMARITPCLENGKHAYINILDKDEIAYGSTEYIVLCGKADVTDNEFVYYFSHSPIFKNTAIKSMVGSSGRQRAQTDVLKDLVVNIPISVSEQKEIAGILSSLDAKIETNNKLNEKLEEMAQAIFKSWFVDFEPFKDKPFHETELGIIPEGWEVKHISENDFYISDFVSNGSFASLKQNVTLLDYPDYAYFIRNTDLKVGKFKVYVNKESYDFLSKSKLIGGEIIISNVGDVGSVFLCPKLEKPMTLGNNIIMIKPSNEIFKYYLFQYFSSPIGQYMIDGISGGSVQRKFNKTDFRAMKILIPSKNILMNYYNIIKPVFDFKEELGKENDRLASLRDTLLPRLMSGELTV